MDNLESKEKEKYNHLVLKHNYGNDYDRKSQIKKIEERLGTVSTLYADILTDLMKGREEGIAEFKALDIGSGPGGVMDWLEHEYNADVYGIDMLAMQRICICLQQIVLIWYSTLMAWSIYLWSGKRMF